MPFGDTLKKLRQEAGLSQSQLAEKADLPFQSIQNWEQNRRSPRPEALVAIAVALGVTLDALLADIRPAPAKKTPAKKSKK